MAVDLNQAIAPRAGNPHSWWRAITALIVLAIFLQSVFAGAMLSGFAWARAAHAATASIVVAAALLASLGAIVTLRRSRNGRRLVLILLGLTAAVVVQFVLGKMAAKGDNVLWAHVPLGVMLVGLAGHAVARARRLGEDAATT
jgi:hypothetical protein